MTRIHELLSRGPTASLEFFPPRSARGDRRLRDTIAQLATLEPSFVSVTYGAGGSTRDRTHDLVVDLRRVTTTMPHLTARGHNRDQLAQIIAGHLEAGVDNLLCLAGDPPADGTDEPSEVPHAIDLVRLARSLGGHDLSIGVAAHPEVHPRSPDRGSDRDHLAAKLVEADFGITQFFFRADDYWSMVGELEDRGCTTPVVPGIMPITDLAQVERFAALSGAAVPGEVRARLRPVADDPAAVRAVGVELATELCQQLLDDGAPGLHHYTLNRPTATRQVHTALTWPAPVAGTSRSSR